MSRDDRSTTETGHYSSTSASKAPSRLLGSSVAEGEENSGTVNGPIRDERHERQLAH